MKILIGVVAIVCILGLVGHAQVDSAITKSEGDKVLGLADKENVIRHARAAYYNATEKGLASFQCDVIPDWRFLMSDLYVKDKTVAESQISLLSSIKYTVTVGPKGVTQFTHSTVEANSL